MTAQQFPNAHITGTDLSPIQPNEVPSNVHFVIDDFNQEDWGYPLGSFDIIRSSILMGSVSSWPHHMRTACRNLKPATGWLECWEVDLTPRCDDGTLPPFVKGGPNVFAYHEWLDLAEHSLRNGDPPKTFKAAPNLRAWMQDAGFVDIRERVHKVPTNQWPRDPRLKKLGAWYERNWLDGLFGFTVGLFGQRGLGWSKDEIEVFLVNVRKAISNRHFHVYHNFHVVIGRRPGPDEVPQRHA